MPLLIDDVKQALEQLGLPEDKMKDVLATQQERFDAIKAGKKPEGPTRVGEIALGKKYVTEEQLQHGLGLQAKEYGKMAAKDLANIAENGKQEIKLKKDGKPHSEPFWNTEALKTDKTIQDAAINVAHTGRTMAILANNADDKKLAAKLLPSAQAAEALSAVLANPETAAQISKDDMRDLRDKAIQGLKDASRETGVKPKGRDGKEIDIEAYAKQLSESIEKAYDDNKLRQNARGAVNGMETPVAGGAEYSNEGGAIAPTRPGGRARN